jgi:hypothetical protein
MLLGVNYTLHKDKDYERLYKLLHSTGTYCRVLESFWIIKTSESLDVWHQRIKSVTDSDDYFMLHDMTEAIVNRKVRGWLPKQVVAWIDSYIGIPAYVA